MGQIAVSSTTRCAVGNEMEGYDLGFTRWFHLVISVCSHFKGIRPNEQKRYSSRQTMLASCMNSQWWPRKL